MISFESRLIKKLLGQEGLNLYKWFWSHTEFWLPRKDRRPYTFIIRDFYHGSPMLTLLLIGTLSYTLGRWWIPLSPAIMLKGLIVLLAGILLGHLFFGTPWQKGEGKGNDKAKG